MQIVIGVTGGIAAYKVTGLIRILTEAGHNVKVVPTQNALRFIGATTLEALSHNTVDSDLYSDVESVKHISLAKNADLVIVAPATASFIARYAAGLADDLLGNLLLATTAPVLVAPAMHTEMWSNPATVANIKTLESRGVSVLEPDSGRLTGEDSGPGRLPEVEKIAEAALQLLVPKDLAGIEFLITAGGTQEPIDPVRYIGNRSSGKQGIAIALAALSRGARVKLIAANISEIPNSLTEVITVTTAAELSTQVLSNLSGINCLVMAAAVSDYSVEIPSVKKIKKTEGSKSLTLSLVETDDILKNATSLLGDSKTVTVGFAAETAQTPEELETLAIGKMTRKNCDLMVANPVFDFSNGKSVFGSDSNHVLIVSRDSASQPARGSKMAVAHKILDAISDTLGNK